MRLRSISRVHRLAEGNTVIVRLAVSEEPLWREFWEMVTVLGIGLPVTVILVALTGYLVAARALKPVDSMAQRAAQITAEQLNERLHIENPNDELGQLGSAFNSTLARLERSFDQLRRFTADASHELRTPLTAIQSVGEVSLKMHGDVSYYRDKIGSMLEETNRLTQLVDSLDGNRSTIVKADRTILRQSLVNLVHNAVKYSPERGEIRLSIHETEQDAIVEVEDSGPGIAPEHRTRIFERFYRVDKSRTRAAGGAGLGLSIAQWAVLAHGGTIAVHSEPGSGSIFQICLPKHVSSVGVR
jgi:signal transduction histidine kinase